MNAIAPLRIDKPGLYRLPSKVYHRDPVNGVSLSHSIAKLMLTKSPLHAKAAHPKLSPNRKPEKPTEAKDRGSILHTMILGEGSAYQVLDYPNFLIKEAQRHRNACRAAGIIPVLAHVAAEYRECAEAVKEQIRQHPQCEEFFDEGASEITMIWQEGPVFCRSLIDRILERPGAPMFDLKSTIRDASPRAFSQTIERDYATQAAFYMRGARAVLDVPPSDFRFIAFETYPPYAISVHSLSPEMMDVAEARIFEAVKAFARGLIVDDWPGYSTDLHKVMPSAREINKMIEAEPEEPTIYTEIDDLLVEERLAA